MASDETTIALAADPEHGLGAAPAERRQRGRQQAPTKRQVTLRLDPDVLDRFRAGGPGWQGRINAALRHAAGL